MIKRRFATSSYRRHLAAVGLVLALGLAGCGEDNNAKNPVTPVPSNSSQLTGTFLGASETGRVSLSVATADLAHSSGTATVAVVGTAVFAVDASGTFDLAGTYNPETDSLYVTGSGYTLVGQHINGVVPGIAGVYVGPKGTGHFEVLKGSDTQVGVYCGTYKDAANVQQGRWNFITYQSLAIGFASPGPGGFIRMTGQASGTGSTRSLTFTSEPQYGHMTGAGTLNTLDHHSSGTWEITENSATTGGTWNAEFCESGGEGGATIAAP